MRKSLRARRPATRIVQAIRHDKPPADKSVLGVLTARLVVRVQRSLRCTRCDTAKALGLDLVVWASVSELASASALDLALVSALELASAWDLELASALGLASALELGSELALERDLELASASKGSAVLDQDGCPLVGQPQSSGSRPARSRRIVP